MISSLFKSCLQTIRSRAAMLRAILLIVLVILLALLLGFATAYFGAIAAFGFVGILLSLVFLVAALRQPFLVLVILIVTSFSVDYLVNIFGLPSVVTYVQVLLVGLLFFLALQSSNNNQALWWSQRPLIGGLIALLLVIVLSAILNTTSPIVVLSGLKNYLLYPLLFLAIVLLDLPEKSQRIIRNLLLGLILIQVPIAILQHYSFIPGAAAKGTGITDLAGGTIGSNTTGILSLLCVGVAGIMLTLIVFDKVRMRYLATAMLAIVGPIIAEGKVAVFLLPVVVLIIIILNARYKYVGWWYRLIVVIFIAIALAYAIIYLINALGLSNSLLDWLNSPKDLLQYMTTIGGDPLLAKFGRLTDLRVTVNLLERNVQSLLLGFGPGMLARTAQAYTVFAPFYMYLQKGIGSIQATSILLEVGFLGAITYLMLPLIVAAGILRVPRLALDSALVLQISSFIVVTMLYLLGIFYSQPWWSAALSVSYWTFVGMVWTNARNSELKYKGTL